MGALIRATITESLRTQGLIVVHYFTTSLCNSRYFSESEQAVENGLITADSSNNEVVSSASDYFFERENINCFSDQTLYSRDFTPVSQGYGLPITFSHFVWYESWRAILHQFSFCAFTYQADYSPALSGLAQCSSPCCATSISQDRGVVMIVVDLTINLVEQDPIQGAEY